MKKLSTSQVMILLLVGLLSACSTSQDCCTVIDTAVNIHYLDQQGKNWLTEQGITEQNLTVYFVKEGQAEKIYRGNLDAPKMCKVIEGESAEKELRLFPSDYLANSYSLTLLEFPDGKVDTVKCYIETKGINQICKQVWYNGASKWQAGQTSRRIEIIK